MHERTANENANAAPVVLVVEDELFLRCDLADCLREAGWDVLEAASADRAMAVCRDGMAVHILITDIQLNGPANGWDVAEAFRAVRSDVAVIYRSADAHDRTRSVPNSLHFNKPYRTTEVVKACRNSCSRTHHCGNPVLPLSGLSQFLGTWVAR